MRRGILQQACCGQYPCTSAAPCSCCCSSWGALRRSGPQTGCSASWGASHHSREALHLLSAPTQKQCPHLFPHAQIVNSSIYKLSDTPSLAEPCDAQFIRSMLQAHYLPVIPIVDVAIRLKSGCCAVTEQSILMWMRRLDDPGYSAPVYLRLPTVVLFVGSGFAVSWLLSLSLGDATWGVSTGVLSILLLHACAP